EPASKIRRTKNVFIRTKTGQTFASLLVSVERTARNVDFDPTMHHLGFFASSLLVILLTSPLTSGQYSRGCSRAVENIPDPSSDSCQAFFRCFQGRQYSLRCPLGQVFDFDRSRC
ncbi:hypothetical protein EGW08_011448, partial [Elysia chlorotica]